MEQLNNNVNEPRRPLTRATVLESPWFQDTDKESRKTPNSNSHMFHSSVKRHPRLQLTLHFSDSTGYKLQAMRPTTPYHHCTLYSACLVGLTFSSTVFPRRAILYKRQPNAPPSRRLRPVHHIHHLSRRGVRILYFQTQPQRLRDTDWVSMFLQDRKVTRGMTGQRLTPLQPATRIICVASAP